jgi:hypothetical protein
MAVPGAEQTGAALDEVADLDAVWCVAVVRVREHGRRAPPPSGARARLPGPAPNHELAAEELMLSRSSYFRNVRQATRRVADYIAGQR